MSEIKKVVTFGPLEAKGIEMSQYQKKGTKTLKLYQEVTTVAHYPSVKVGHELQSDLFAKNEFDIETTEHTNVEKRWAFINIPANATEAQIKAKLTEHVAQGARIYKWLSSAPILTNDQRAGIEKELTTLDKIAESQMVRDGEGNIIKDTEGRFQYRRTFYTDKRKEDIDDRGKVEEYIPTNMRVNDSRETVTNSGNFKFSL